MPFNTATAAQRLLGWRLRAQRFLRLREEHLVLGWAALAGLAGAMAVFAFREAIHGMQWLLGGEGGSLVDMARRLPWYLRVVLPAGGGLVAGALLWLARRQAPEASSDYMEAITLHGGHVPVRNSLLRAASSLFTIASGGSIGREGSMVQLAALCASLLGRVLRLEPATLRLLVACGAAAGISSAYNAPIAGVFFVAEIVFGSLVLQNFGPMVIASAVANVTMREFPIYAPAYNIPDFPAIAGAQLVACVILGVLAGLLAPQFLRLLGRARELFQRSGLPLPLRLGLGGLFVGIISVGVPEVWGNGYSVVNSLLHERWIWSSVLLVLVAKVLATALTSGSGAVGGVFTPTMFVGAASGYLFAVLVQVLWPAAAAPPFVYAIVGMSAFLAGATGAPLMAIVMIFEMTLSYEAMLPLMLASVLAHLVARSAGTASMYEITARRRRDEEERERLRETRMQDLIRPAEAVVSAQAPFAEVAGMFLRVPAKFLYVVDEHQRFLGVIPLQAVVGSLVEPQMQPPAGERRAIDLLQRDFPAVTSDMSLTDALQIFLQHAGERLPVIDSREVPTLLGVVYKSSLLDAYARLTAADPPD